MSIDAIVLEMEKALGKNDEAQSVTQFINSGYPPLNYAMTGRYDGGYPYGRLVEIYGESSSGKSLMATKAMIECQKLGGVAILIDWERSFDVGMAEELGLNSERPYWIYHRSNTWEKGNMEATKACEYIRKNKIIPPEAPIVVVFDSIASAVPQSTIDKELSEMTMNDSSALSRVASTTLKTQAHHAADHNACFIYLNQVREKIGVIYGDKTSTPGGKAMGFFATCRLSLTRKKIQEQIDGNKEFVGQDVNINVVKSKLTAPYKSCSLRVNFDERGMAHFDEALSLIDYLVDKEFIKSSGPRVTWTDGKMYFRKALAEKINEEGLYDELKVLLLVPISK